MTSTPIIAFLGAPDVPPPHNLAEIEQLATVRHCTADTLGAALPGADVLVLWDCFSRGLRDHWGAATSDLRWVHVCAAGVDSLMFDELTASDVVVTNAHGVFDQPIAEFVLTSIMARHKCIQESQRLQERGVWRHRETTRTAGTSALVIGTGGIGRAVARLLRAVGITVAGGGRTARTDDPDFGTVYPTEHLVDHVGDFDSVIAIAPLTPQTERMIDAAVLDAMKPTAHFVNVGRGQLVDEAALVDALQAGRIAAASLDVFDTEPLPADSPLWSMEQVSISAHMSGDVVGWRDELADAFLANLRRYRASDSEDFSPDLRNVVDKARGYVMRGSARAADSRL